MNEVIHLEPQDLLKFNEYITLNDIVDLLITANHADIIQREAPSIGIGTERTIHQNVLDENGIYKIKRPLNSYMLFAKLNRTNFQKRWTNVSNKIISAKLGMAWRVLEKNPYTKTKYVDFYHKLADEIKMLHEKAFPDYVYQPRRRPKILSFENDKDLDVGREYDIESTAQKTGLLQTTCISPFRNRENNENLSCPAFSSIKSWQKKIAHLNQARALCKKRASYKAKIRISASSNSVFHWLNSRS